MKSTPKHDFILKVLVIIVCAAISINIFYIGDSEVDGATGKAAGMDTILVSWGFRSRDVLEAAKPLSIADTTDEILEIIREKD